MQIIRIYNLVLPLDAAPPPVKALQKVAADFEIVLSFCRPWKS